jgi:hypothetical protein
MTETTVPDDPRERAGQRLTMDYPVELLERPKAGKTVRAPSAMARTTNRTSRIVNEVDLSEVQRQFEQRLDDLLQQWTDITAKQRAEILDQVRLAVTSDDLAALASLHVNTGEATQALTDAMADMALDAARGMSREAGRQGVRIDPVASDQSLFANIAAATVVLLAQGLTNAAGRQALRQWSVSTSGDDVVGAVREHLESLSDAFLRDNLGGALTSAQNTGRLNTALSGPVASLYASEVMDRNTCPPCASVDGKWLGNTDDPDTPARVAEVYPNGGYRFCEGGVRCRGTVIGIWRPEQVS